jgi:hypothetical protein
VARQERGASLKAVDKNSSPAELIEEMKRQLGDEIESPIELAELEAREKLEGLRKLTKDPEIAINNKCVLSTPAC